MITKCGQCGKSFDVLYPDLWRYVRGKTYLCSWSCLRKYDGEEFDDMGRTKKDGTPAKKPGPKPKKPEAEEKIPEPAGGGEWEKMEAPEANQTAAVGKPEKHRKRQLEIALLSDVLDDWNLQYRKFGGKMIVFADGSDPLELSRDEWIQLSREILDALEQLEVKE